MCAECSFTRLYTESVCGQKVVSAANVEGGQVVASFAAARVLDAPTPLTVQVSEDRHIVLEPAILGLLNHSCHPNAVLDADTMRLLALKPIGAGEELTLFYPSTEWEMAEPFPCECRSPYCIGVIRGARFLPHHVLVRYRLAPHIVRLIGARSREVVRSSPASE